MAAGSIFTPGFVVFENFPSNERRVNANHRLFLEYFCLIQLFHMLRVLEDVIFQGTPVCSSHLDVQAP